MAMILVNTYSGMLTSYLTIPSYKPVINSFEDLAERRDIHLLSDYNSTLTNMFLVNASTIYKRFDFPRFIV